MQGLQEPPGGSLLCCAALEQRGELAAAAIGAASLFPLVLTGRQRRRQRAATHPGSLEAPVVENGSAGCCDRAWRAVGGMQRHPLSAVDRRLALR